MRSAAVRLITEASFPPFLALEALSNSGCAVGGAVVASAPAPCATPQQDRGDAPAPAPALAAGFAGRIDDADAVWGR